MERTVTHGIMPSPYWKSSLLDQLSVVMASAWGLEPENSKLENQTIDPSVGLI